MSHRVCINAEEVGPDSLLLGGSGLSSLELASSLLGELLPERGNIFVALVLLDKKVLQPLVLSLKLGDLGLQVGNLFGHLLGRLLESLLTLLLLDAEASTGRSVTPALVLFGGNTGRLLVVDGLCWRSHGLGLALFRWAGSGRELSGNLGLNRGIAVARLGEVVHLGGVVVVGIEFGEAEVVCRRMQC